MIVEVLEAIMLVCFGCSWPVNLRKSIVTKSTKGKSLLFLILIDTGYVAGMLSKILNTNFDWSTKWWVFALYAINFSMVLTDIILYFINKKRENAEAKGE